MYQQAIDKIKPHLEKTIDYLKNELASLQAGRATPTLLENLDIKCYGQIMPLKQLASIQAPEPRVILVRPWDKSIIKEIESAIRNSRLGVSPVLDDDVIRINIPPLSEERRREFLRIAQEKAEECRISVRRHREEAWKEIQDLEKEKQIGEDDKFKAKEALQKLVDEYNKKIEEVSQKKEAEILKV